MKKVKVKMTLEKLAGMVKNSFVDMDKRMDERFNKVDERLDKVDATMKHGFAEQSSRLTSVERRTAALELK